LMFSGQPRGICGAATLEASVAQVDRLRQSLDQQGFNTELIGVGGIASVVDVKQYLSAGAASVQMATSAMVHPWTAMQIRKQWTDA